MEFLQAYGKEIVSLLVPVITWVLNVGLRPKVKLMLSNPHFFSFLADVPQVVNGHATQIKQTFNTASVRLFNGGRQVAKQVQVVFNYKPDVLNVWPPCEFAKDLDEHNRYVLSFPYLAPKEELRIEILTVGRPLPEPVSGRCEEGLAKKVKVRFVQDIPQWRVNAVIFFALAGLGSAVYWLIVVIQLLVLRTPTP